MDSAALAIALVACGIVSAKWAMELGFGQASQTLHLIGGILFGPLALLVLYLRLLRKQIAAEAEKAAEVVSS